MSFRLAVLLAPCLCCLAPTDLPFARCGPPEEARQPAPLTAEQSARLRERDGQWRQAGQLQAQGKYAEALVPASRVLELTRQLRGPQHAEVADVLTRLAFLHELQGDLDKALPERREVLQLQEKLDGSGHWRTVNARLALRFTERVSAMPRVRRDELVSALRREQQVLRRARLGRPVEEGDLMDVLKVYQDCLGKEDVAAARVLRLVAGIRYSKRDGLGAKEAWAAELAIRRNVLPRDHPDLATCLNNLGVVQHALGDLESARKSLDEALAIRRKVLPKGDPVLAGGLHSLGIVQHELHDHASARKSIDEELAILRKTLPKDHPHTADCLRNLAIVQRALRDFPSARNSIEEELAIRRKTLPQGHPAIAISLNDLGILQQDLRDFPSALKSHEEALAIRRKALPKNHPDIATSLNNLGAVQDDLLDYESARKSHEEALAIRRKILPADDLLIANSFNNLGNVQRKLLDYGSALKSLEEALAIRRKALSKYHPDIALSLYNRALLQQVLQENESARKSHEEALAIRRKALPKDHPDIAHSLNNLGCVQADLLDYGSALKSLEEALAIRRKAFPEGHPDIAESLRNLGDFQVRLGEYGSSRKSHEEALAIYRKLLPKGHPDIARGLINLGNTQWELHDYGPARASYAEALALFRKALPADHPDIAGTLHNLAVLSVVSRQAPKDVPSLLNEALQIQQRDLTRLALAQAESAQLRTAADARVSLDVLLSLADHVRRHPAEVYAQVVAFKGTVMARQRWARQLRDTEDAEGRLLLDQLREVNLKLYRMAFADVPTGQRPADAQALAARVHKLNERRNRLERELAARSSAFRKLLRQEPPSTDRIREALPAGAALLDVIDYVDVSGPREVGRERRLLAFVVRPDRKEVAAVPLGPSERLQRLVEAWRAGNRRGTAPRDEQADPALQLRRLLWQPLAGHLGDVQVVLVSPDGPLNGLPLAALPGDRPGTFLLHQHAFATVPIPQMLPELLRRPRQKGPALYAALAVGGIDFGAAPESVRGGSRREHFSPLPGTEAEARAIHDLFRRSFPDRPAHLLCGERATKEAFLQRAPQCSHLLVATHGFCLLEPKPRAALPLARGGPALRVRIEVSNPQLFSGLAFAGANRPVAVGPGAPLLAALEVSELDLAGVELAVLSACETGLGRVEGGEGVLSLQRAFQLAGARTTVASLWKVPDEATRVLMTRFHRNLWGDKGGSSPGTLQALREAQLWLLHEASKDPSLVRGLARGLDLPEDEQPREGRPLPPSFWAAFVLSGDWR